MKVTHKMGVFVCVLCLCLCLWVYLCLNVGDSKAECQLGGETELLCNQGAARTNRGRQSQRPIDVPTKGLTWPQCIQHQYIKRKMNFHNLWLYHIEIFEGTKKHEDVDILCSMFGSNRSTGVFLDWLLITTEAHKSWENLQSVHIS